MPLLAPLLEPILIGSMASEGIIGTYSAQLASALSQGIATDIITAQIMTTDIGIMGVGVGIGKVLGPNPGILTPMLIGQFSAVGLAGTYTPSMASAISTGFCTWFLANNIVTTIDPGIGIGTGIGQVLGLVPSAMQGLIVGFMSSNGILGMYSPMFAMAVATAICTTVMSTGIVSTVIAGAPIPPIPPTPGTGVGTGFLM